MEKSSKALALAEDNAAKIELLAQKIGAGGGGGGKLRMAVLEPQSGYGGNYFGEVAFKDKTLIIVTFSYPTESVLSVNGEVIGAGKSPIFGIAPAGPGQIMLESPLTTSKAYLVGSFTLPSQ